ncbi:MAG TPA: rhomboid family intramembrane serine protease [Chloroflexi bacterium]|nr:rhomboid family intramembrane serine protease [Chloroflexota bacterium]HBY06800.1 rhomboid family intramembrane serine protease [Chloroflexota bacterium]
MNNNYQPPEDPSNSQPPEFQRDPNIVGRIQPERIPVKLPDAAPTVTYALMGITIVVFILQYATQVLLGYDLVAAYGAKVNNLIAAGQIWRLLTPVFLHGSIMHIGFNMYALNLFGRRLEKYFGHWRFLILYLVAGFGGNVISMMFTQSPSLGASTAIFGLLAAQGIFIYQNRALFGGMSRQALQSIIMVAAINLLIGMSPGIDNWGHIGGLVAGLIFAWIGGPVLAPEGMYPVTRMVDQRENRDILLATVVSGGFFAILALGALFLMGH